MKSLAKLLFLADAFVVLLYVLYFTYGDWPGLFDLDGEQNIGAWWSGCKLMISAAAVLSVPLFSRTIQVQNALLYWAAAIGFAFLSADEILALHERITWWNKTNDLGLPMFRGTHGAWAIVYLGIFATFTLAFFRPILVFAKDDPKSATTLLSGFAALISGAVGVEVLGYYGLLGGMGSTPQVLVEETLELFGITLMTLGCVRHVRYGLTR